jgi:hypothetical protein
VVASQHRGARRSADLAGRLRPPRHHAPLRGTPRLVPGRTGGRVPGPTPRAWRGGTRRRGRPGYTILKFPDLRHVLPQ